MTKRELEHSQEINLVRSLAVLDLKILWQVLHLYYLLGRLAKFRFYLGIFDDQNKNNNTVAAFVSDNDLSLWYGMTNSPVVDLLPDVPSIISGDSEECQKTALLFNYNNALISRQAKLPCDFSCADEPFEGCPNQERLAKQLCSNLQGIGLLKLKEWQPKSRVVYDLLKEHFSFAGSDAEGDNSKINEGLEEFYNLVLGELICARLKECFPEKRGQFEVLYDHKAENLRDFKDDAIEVDVLIKDKDRGLIFITAHQKGGSKDKEWYSHFQKKLAQAYSVFARHPSTRYVYFYAHGFEERDKATFTGISNEGFFSNLD
jgi:hypothetical protein